MSIGLAFEDWVIVGNVIVDAGTPVRRRPAVSLAAAHFDYVHDRISVDELERLVAIAIRDDDRFPA